MQLYDITIAANTTRQLDAPGSYFYYYAGSAGGADSTITLRGLSSGLRLILKPGQAFRLPQGSTETSWVMTNYANAATIVGSVLVGNGDITDNRVTGSVEIIDGGKNRTSAGQAFYANPYCAGTAGTLSHVQLWNPVGSGKNLNVSKIYVSSTTAGTAQLKTSNSMIASPNNAPKSKLISATAASSIALSRSENNVAALGSYVFGIDMPASQAILIEPKESIQIQPGNGVIINHTAFAVPLNVVFDYYEENA